MRLRMTSLYSRIMRTIKFYCTEKYLKKLCSDIYYKKILNVYKTRKELNHFILIYDNCETSSVKRLINQYVDFIYVETFHINSIQYNVTRNTLVPLHEKMSLSDKKKVTHKKLT